METALLLDAIWRLLANDPTLLNFKSLTPASDNVTKQDYIVKEEETEDIVTGSSVPIILLYTRPGKSDHRTPQVYIGKIVIDCFAHDGDTARSMADQTRVLMQNWEPDATLSFVSRFAYDTSFKTGIPGTKGHRIFYDISGFVG